MEIESQELIPPAGAEGVGKAVYELTAKIIKDKIDRGLHAKWEEHYRMSRNKPFRNESVGVPLTSANLLHTHRMRTVNTLTDNEPAFNVAQVGAVDDDSALSRLQHAAEHWWREQEQQDILAASVGNGELNGLAIEKVWFDPDLEIGLGEVRAEVIDPYHFGVWPVSTKRRLQDAEACFHFYPKPVRWVKRRWPEVAEQVKADKELLKDLGQDREKIGSPSNPASGGGAFWSKLVGTVSAAFGMGSEDSDDMDPQTLIIECWVRDWTLEEGEGVTRAKYPGGIRRITVCSGGRVVLDDSPNPSINANLPPEMAMQTHLWDKFPFILVPSIEDPCSIWGQSDMEQLTGLQKSFAITLSQIEYFKNNCVRPKILNPLDSGVHNSEFTNDVGVINPSSSAVAAGIKALEMGSPQTLGELQGVLNLIKDLFFLVAGTFEMEQVQGGNDLAYKAIAALLEHAATMMRGKIRNYQRLIRERGRMFVSLAANFYTEERWISYDGPQGATETEPILGAQLILPAKLTVVSGSTLPRAEGARRDEATNLFQAGAIDDVALLEELDWPARGEVLERKRAGQAGMLVERLTAAGAPPELLAAVQELAQMDDKAFESAAKSGTLPPLTLPTAQPVEDPEAVKRDAEAEKIRMETSLTEEKIYTERARQKQILAGVQYDAQKMAVEMSEKDAGTRSDTNRPGYNEVGMVSNNLEATNV